MLWTEAATGEVDFKSIQNGIIFISITIQFESNQLNSAADLTSNYLYTRICVMLKFGSYFD